MELKTLREIEDKAGESDNEGAWDKWLLGDNIRDEAIKWIKELYKTKENETNMINGLEVCIYEYEQDDSYPMIKWIKHFFNISEEDLKGFVPNL